MPSAVTGCSTCWTVSPRQLCTAGKNGAVAAVRNPGLGSGVLDSSPASFLFFFFLRLFILREREQGGRGEQRERKRVPSSLFTVRVEPYVGLDPTNHEIMT